MEELENKIREAAKREGIDLIGFAPKERFEGVDAAHNPFYKKESWLLPNQPETVSRGVNPYREAYLDEKYPGIRENEYHKTSSLYYHAALSVRK